MPNFIDIHSHLNFPEYKDDREAVITRMKEEKTWTITVGTNLETSKSAVELANKHEGIFACIGLHPADDPNAEWDDAADLEFRKLAKEKKVVAIGECGLDFFRLADDAAKSGMSEDSMKKKQKEIFECQIALSIETGKPLMIHCRSAYEEVYEMLASVARNEGEKLRGNMHFFAGDTKTAKKFLDIGFTLSFTGVITFARQYDEVIRYVPISEIMSETDAPYVAPAPYRGKRNEPNYVKEVVKTISTIKGLDFEETRDILAKNAIKNFNLAL